MGKELHVSGNFIYDGLRNFDEMHSLDDTTEVFNVMYLLSVGIERLQKVCIILSLPEDDVKGELFVNKIKHHNHVSLMESINDLQNVKLKPNEHAFLNLLNKFYNQLRYGRYSMEDFHLEDEKKDFLQFLNRLGVDENPFGLLNNDRIKRFLGKIVGGICEKLYNLIKEECRILNLYTYETNYNSKAFKVFEEKRYTFFAERQALKELIIYCFNEESFEMFREAIKKIDHLDLDVQSLKPLETYFEKKELTETVQYFYSELTNQERKHRQEVLDLLSDESTDWDLLYQFLKAT